MAKTTIKEHISTVEARNRFSEVINRAAFGKERIILTRRGKDLVAVVPMEDVELLESLADQLDIKLADAVKKNIEAGEPTLPLDEVAKAWGIG
ncbi:MAG: type II toxin-antitoxin system Phd/YefM family antitoxin [Candidatus Marinimicrobia bacterium]|nr:type II toxin-antitoxin system Phd/YefM family antitoxin [Candidatus Neomarinimicrobiota bacterium]